MTAQPVPPTFPDAGADAARARPPHLRLVDGEATPRRQARRERAAFLVDAHWPEYEAYVRTRRRRTDVLGVPVAALADTRWGAEGFATVHASSLLGLLRSRESADVAAVPGASLRVRAKYDELIARSYIPLLGPDVSEVVVSQNLLPHLWRAGVLAGRIVDVLMVRLPLATLHARLDAAAWRRPLSMSLTAWRAPTELVAAEAEALASARRIITPHSEVADLAGERAERLPWQLPERWRCAGGDRVALAGRADGCHGAYELRDVARERSLALTTLTPPLEYISFWRSVDVRQRDPRDNWLADVAVAALPAHACSRPHWALRAVASGVRVVATAAAGLAGLDGVVEVPVGDADALRRALVPT